MNTRPRRDHIRKPTRKDRLQAVAETMAHFSRVARKPIWFTFDQLWDIHEKVSHMTRKKYSKRMTSAQGFPTRQQFGFFAGRHAQIKSKNFPVKINHNGPKNSDNVQSKIHYAFVHHDQTEVDGVFFGGVE